MVHLCSGNNHPPCVLYTACCRCCCVCAQLSDKTDLIKKGVAAHEASTKVAVTTKQLLDATKDWVTEGAKMAQG